MARRCFRLHRWQHAGEVLLPSWLTLIRSLAGSRLAGKAHRFSLRQLIILIPSFIFLEASLAFLGLSDPVLPTWGKLVHAAIYYGIHREVYHLLLIPAAVLMITGYGFALVGFEMERNLYTRLYEGRQLT